MCYAIPGRISKIEGMDATIDYGGVKKKANVQFLSDAKVGDYVLVHAGFAIERMDEKSAKESLKLIQEAMETVEGK